MEQIKENLPGLIILFGVPIIIWHLSYDQAIVVLWFLGVFAGVVFASLYH